MKSQVEQQFTPYTTVQAEGVRVGLVTCLECGALVMLEQDTAWDQLHLEWHERWRGDG